MIMSGRSKPTERMHEPVKVWELKKSDRNKYGVLDCHQVCNLLELEIENMNDLFFRTNIGLNRNESLEVRTKVIESLCDAFGDDASEINLLKIRMLTAPYLTDDRRRNVSYDTPHMSGVMVAITNLREKYGLQNPCEKLYSDGQTL